MGRNDILQVPGNADVLFSSQYTAIYSDSAGFDPKAPLPLFLKRVLTNCSLLFIGCSLSHDRTIMIMESFIQLFQDIFTNDTIHFSIKEKFYLQLEEAPLAASANRDKRLINWVCDLYDFCTSRGFTDFYSRLIQWVEALFPEDQKVLKTVYAYRALKYSRDCKLEETMKFYKKEEKICEELEDRAKVTRNWWNQGLIYNNKRNYKKRSKPW